MKWFKHNSQSHNDIALSAMIDELGMEGYGVYWVVVESIASQAESQDFFCEYSAKKWANICGTSAKKIEKFFKTFAKLQIFSVEFFENSIRVDMPNMLNLQDEWTQRKAKNSGVTRELLGSKDKDKEVDKNIYNTPHNPPKKSSPKKPPTPTPSPIDAIPDGIGADYRRALLDFVEFRRGKKAPMTPRAMELLMRKLDTLSGGNEATKIAILEQSIVCGWTGVFDLKTNQPSDNTRQQPKKNGGVGYIDDTKKRDYSAFPEGCRTAKDVLPPEVLKRIYGDNHVAQ